MLLQCVLPACAEASNLPMHCSEILSALELLWTSMPMNLVFEQDPDLMKQHESIGGLISG